MHFRISSIEPKAISRWLQLRRRVVKPGSVVVGWRACRRFECVHELDAVLPRRSQQSVASAIGGAARRARQLEMTA
jgi:hypothetical protein